MGLFFLLAMALSVSFFFVGLKKTFESETITNKNECPPHKWSLKKHPLTEDTYIKCSKCNKLPSLEGEEL